MNLHRVEDNMPQWEKESPEEWNIWQRVAAETGGVFAPANFMTVAGGIGSNSGIEDMRRGKYVRAFLKIGLSRIVGDVGDGAVASKTRTMSPLGEALDASTDKLLATKALVVGMQENIIPKTIGGPILAEQVGIAALSFVGKRRGHKVQPDGFDKIGHASVWLSSGLFLASRIPTLKPEVQQKLHKTGLLLGGVTIAMGMVTLRNYTHKAFPDEK